MSGTPTLREKVGSSHLDDMKWKKLDKDWWAVGQINRWVKEKAETHFKLVLFGVLLPNSVLMLQPQAYRCGQENSTDAVVLWLQY